MDAGTVANASGAGAGWGAMWGALQAAGAGQTGAAALGTIGGTSAVGAGIGAAGAVGYMAGENFNNRNGATIAEVVDWLFGDKPDEQTSVGRIGAPANGVSAFPEVIEVQNSIY